jgi:hypothetical protein
MMIQSHPLACKFPGGEAKQMHTNVHRTLDGIPFALVMAEPQVQCEDGIVQTPARPARKEFATEIP